MGEEREVLRNEENGRREGEGEEGKMRNEGRN